jgi:class 3 adenylate cyclase
LVTGTAAATGEHEALTRGFLFTDLRGYTAYVDAHGDHAAAELLDAYRGLVREAVARGHGAEIKTEGDSFYVVFPSAGAAVRCGLAITAAAALASEEGPDRPIRVAVGVHAGEAVETAEGFVGLAVNIAARICAQAKAGEVVVSETVRALTRTHLDVSFQPLGARRLKGVEESIRLFRVVPASTAVPARSIRRSGPRVRPRWLAAAAALLAIVLVAIVGALGPTATAPSPTGSVGVDASPSSSSRPSAPVSSSPGSGLNADETRLLNRIPSDFQPYCGRSSLSDGSAGGSVSLRCDLPADSPGYGADTVWYDTFGSISEMKVAFTTIAKREDLPAGDCSLADVQAVGRWAFGSTYAGQLACYAKGGAWIMWSYEGEQILARALRRDGVATSLRSWWNDRAAAYLR